MVCSALCTATPQPQFYNADEYAKRLVGNAYSIPSVDIILRRLQRMFASKRYEGYTYSFEWKDSGPDISDDDSRVSDDDEELFPALLAVASMPSHSQPDEDEQHDDGKQRPSAISSVPRKQARPKREDQNQKSPAHDDDVDEKELPTARVPMSSHNDSPALSGQEISDAHKIAYKKDEECSLPEKPIVTEGCESEIPGPDNTPQCQVGDLSEVLMDI
jgi:hypothetical protein